MYSTRFRVLIATLWAGSLWAIGYIVAPTLFMTLDDKTLAGTIAGNLFRVEAWLTLYCGGTLLLLHVMRPSEAPARMRRIWIGIIIAMMGCTLIGYFGVQPMMSEIREAAGPAGIMESEARSRFALWHGISSGIYLLQSVLAIALVLRARD
jgi:hypothetical protein